MSRPAYLGYSYKRLPRKFLKANKWIHNCSLYDENTCDEFVTSRTIHLEIGAETKSKLINSSGPYGIITIWSLRNLDNSLAISLGQLSFM